MPSSRNDTASTMYPMTKSLAGSGSKSSWMPWVIDTAAPATNSPSAANSDQTYASRPKPSGCRSSAGRLDRLLAIIRKISLPVSAQECAASATIEAEPVSAAAQLLATATRKLAPKAISTVSVLSEPDEGAVRSNRG